MAQNRSLLGGQVRVDTSQLAAIESASAGVDRGRVKT